MNSNPGQGKYLYVDEGHLDYRERTEKDRHSSSDTAWKRNV
jgi:hypothetical protein